MEVRPDSVGQLVGTTACRVDGHGHPLVVGELLRQVQRPVPAVAGKARAAQILYELIGTRAILNGDRGLVRVQIHHDEVTRLQRVALGVGQRGVQHELQIEAAVSIRQPTLLQVNGGEPIGVRGLSHQMGALRDFLRDSRVEGSLVPQDLALGGIQGRVYPARVPLFAQLVVYRFLGLGGPQVADRADVGDDDGLKLRARLQELLAQVLRGGVVRDFDVVGDDVRRTGPCELAEDADGFDGRGMARAGGGHIEGDLALALVFGGNQEGQLWDGRNQLHGEDGEVVGPLLARGDHQKLGLRPQGLDNPGVAHVAASGPHTACCEIILAQAVSDERGCNPRFPDTTKSLLDLPLWAVLHVLGYRVLPDSGLREPQVVGPNVKHKVPEVIEEFLFPIAHASAFFLGNGRTTLPSSSGDQSRSAISSRAGPQSLTSGRQYSLLFFSRALRRMSNLAAGIVPSASNSWLMNRSSNLSSVSFLI